MKQRDGFVSNSSSSSFVVAGVFVENKHDEKWAEAIEEAQEGYGDSLGWHHTEYDSTSGVLGINVTSFDQGALEEISLDQLANGLAKAKKLLEDGGLDASEASLFNVSA